MLTVRPASLAADLLLQDACLWSSPRLAGAVPDYQPTATAQLAFPVGRCPRLAGKSGESLDNLHGAAVADPLAPDGAGSRRLASVLASSPWPIFSVTTAAMFARVSSRSGSS